jgi:hypothetical protein
MGAMLHARHAQLDDRVWLMQQVKSSDDLIFVCTGSVRSTIDAQVNLFQPRAAAAALLCVSCIANGDG